MPRRSARARPTPGPGAPPRHPWWIGPAARILSGVMNLLVTTVRLRVGEGAEHLDRLAASDEPVIFAFWHNRMVICGTWIGRRLIRERRPVALLTSLSRDGELAARMARILGYQVVRGSTSRGGLVGLRRLHRTIRAGSSAATAPDGPRGPAQVVQPGTLMLAMLAGTPIVPIAFAASHAWRLRSWDRLVVPKPFCRAVLTVGEPIAASADLSHDQLAEAAAMLERRLNELVARAQELV